MISTISGTTITIVTTKERTLPTAFIDTPCIHRPQQLPHITHLMSEIQLPPEDTTPEPKITQMKQSQIMHPAPQDATQLYP